MALFVLLLPIVSASEWDDKETMENCGLVLQYGVPWIMGIILLTNLTTFNRGGAPEAVWFIFSFIQYVRWFGLANIGQNQGFHHFISKLNNMFDWYELYDGKDSSRVDEHMFKVYGISLLRTAKGQLLKKRRRNATHDAWLYFWFSFSHSYSQVQEAQIHRQAEVLG